MKNAATDSITLATADFLLSAQGRATLHALQDADLSEENTLALLSHLRRSLSASEAGAALAMARLRKRAVEKFPASAQLFFTPDALEQATAWPVALHRARWIDRYAPAGPVLDLGCGIGGDTLALAQRRPVIAIDQDLLRLRFAQANAEAIGVAGRCVFHHADWTVWLESDRLPQAAAAFADPARRVEGRRVFSLYEMQPPLEALLALQERVPALGVKVMPGVRDAELPPGCGVEFISHNGICKEAVLWFGRLAQMPRWASVHTGAGWEMLSSSNRPAPFGPLEAPCFLHEPDPAVIRSGALYELCQRLNAHLFDPQIAYLVTTQPVQDALVHSFSVLEVHRFGLKTLNRRLQTLGIGEVELKKRGFPVAPEALRPQLKLAPGGRRAVVIFTRRGDERLMVLAERMA